MNILFIKIFVTLLVICFGTSILGMATIDNDRIQKYIMKVLGTSVFLVLASVIIFIWNLKEL